jgi:DNA-binding response OmpR family regulator
MAHRQLSLLLVDDQADMRELLARRLARDGFHVATAASGERALEMMRVERYDLVLLDLQMPGLDGHETLAHIVADAALRAAAVIMLTATNAREAVLRCLQAGAADYIVKPYDFIEMKTRIWRVAVARGLANVKRDDAGAIEVAAARVLVVDDQELNRDLLARRVQQIGHHPSVAASGAEALARLRAEPHDLMLLDIQMPGMDGFEVLRTIRADEQLCGTAVMLVSALNDSTTIARGYELGSDDYVTKPFSSVELRARMTICLAVLEAKRAERARHARLAALAHEGAALGFHDNVPAGANPPAVEGVTRPKG